jgi:hypothetical protein
MSKVDRTLKFLPAFCRAGQRGKLLYAVVQSLLTPLDEADTSLMRIQRAHRLKVAEDIGDVLHLASALNLTPFHFEDITGNAQLAYEERLARVKERIVRIAKVHLTGLGTPWAILETAALFLDANLVPADPNGQAIRHLDANGYSHASILEYTRMAGAPRQHIALYENPLARRKSQPQPRWPLDHWTLQNQGAETAPLILTITGIGERTVCPGIFSASAGVGIVFNGLVPDGKTLRVDPTSGARIDDVPVDAWVTYYRGAPFDFALFDQPQLAVEQGGLSEPFDGDLESAAANIVPPQPSPPLPVGQSDWCLQITQGVFDSTCFDWCVQSLPEEPIGIYDSDPVFDSSVLDFPASAVVACGWDERQLCAFKLALPEQLAASGTSGSAGPNLVSRIAALLPRFKAAGVRAYVDTARPGWILGEGILRSAQATDGAGMNGDNTILRSPRSDLYVDTEAAA